MKTLPKSLHTNKHIKSKSFPNFCAHFSSNGEKKIIIKIEKKKIILATILIFNVKKTIDSLNLWYHGIGLQLDGDYSPECRSDVSCSSSM